MANHTRRSHLLGLAALSVGVAATTRPAFAIETSAYLGVWSGALVFGDKRLRFKLVISSLATAELYSVDQGGAETRATTVTLTPDKATIEFGTLNEVFNGSLSASDTLAGDYIAVGKATPLTFTRGDLFPYAAVSPASLSNAREASGAPAICGAYAAGGGPTSILFDGVRQINETVPVAFDDHWRLGSVAKAMTATLAARLVEAGVITWDTRIGDVLSAQPLDHEAYRRATLRELLQHRAGFQQDLTADDYGSFSPNDDKKARADRTLWAHLAMHQPSVAAPGTRMSYSNSGYVIAAAMMETLSGKTWETLMQAEVFLPLGLQNVGFGAPGRPGQLDQPVGHLLATRSPLTLTPAPPGSSVDGNPIAKAPAGGGGIHMSLLALVT